MKTSIWLTLDDLIFEGRNKMYGAYLLRKEYPRHLASAVSFISALLLLALPLPQYLKRNTTFDTVETPAKPNQKVIEIELPPLEIPKKSAQVADPVIPVAVAVAKPEKLPTRIAKHDNPVVTVPTDQITGTPPASGTEGGAGTIDIPGSGGGTDTGTGTSAVNTTPVIVEAAEVRPQFPGGDAELVKQINKLIRYPKKAVDAGISGVVYVSFVVDPKGNVSRIKVEKGIGGDCDKEAIRVISQLQGWSPAMQNGNPVFFKYVMPVRFVLSN